MKQFIKLTLIAFFPVLLLSCKQSSKEVTNWEDYKRFIRTSNPSIGKIQGIDVEIDFWNDRLKQKVGETMAQSKLGGLYSSRFDCSGNIQDLMISDSFYKEARKLQTNLGSGVYRSLATNAIKQHRFKDAKRYLDSAESMGDNLAHTVLQQFDTDLELGNVRGAQKYLARYASKNSVEYLIREAKLADHQGDLATAIQLMEKAFDLVKDSKEKAIYSWIKTNLSDYYAHNNEYQKAYHSYLEVLELDPSNFHALKGIAWLAFSHDHNPVDARNILMFLKNNHPVPDYDLLLAQIAEYENDESSKELFATSFLKRTQNPGYGAMYNMYLFNLYANGLNEPDKALAIAEQEVQNRPTAEAYSLLSWAYYKKGNMDKAMEIAKNKVENKTFEPHALYRMAFVYKAAGEIDKAKKYGKMLEDAKVELGPILAESLKSIS